MPAADSLEWIEKSDFSGGLWDRKTLREVPENGLLECTDCYPQPTGGLRAFAKFKPVSHTGLPTNSLILGIWKLRPPFPQGRLYLANLELETATSPSRHTFRIFSMQVDDIEEIETGTWNEDSVHTDIHTIDTSIRMVTFRTSNAAGAGPGNTGLGYRNYYNLPVAQGTSGDDFTTMGVYRLGNTTDATDTASSGFRRTIRPDQAGLAANTPLWYGDLASYQARLLHTATFNQLHNRIYMSDQGNDRGTSNFLDPLGERAGAVTWLEPFASDYLTVAKSQTGALTIQGDFLNAVTRQLTFSHDFMQSFPVATSQGVFFMVSDDACYMASQGGVENITPNFYGTPMNPGFYPATFQTANSDNIKLSAPTLAGDFLFAGKGFVMDVRTGAWFQTSGIPDSKNHTTDKSFFRAFATSNEVYDGQDVIFYAYYLENQDATPDTWNPSSSYVFTLPISFTPHQQTQVREVEYHVDAFHPNSSVQVEVFAGGPGPEKLAFERTYEITSSGPQKIRCSGIRADADWVKIRTRLQADSKLPDPAEAPALERMLVGAVPQTRYAQANRR